MHIQKKGKNLLDVQEINRSLVINLLRTKEIWSRAELSRETGLKRSTISNIINDFINWDLVYETGAIYGKRNTRSIGIALSNYKFGVIGIRLSRHFFSIRLFDLAGVEYDHKVIKIDVLSGPKIAIRRIKEEVNNLLKDNRLKRRIIGIGIAIPGPYFQKEGRIVLMTEFPGWEKISIKNELQSLFDIPVYIEHDANAAALTEWWFGKNIRNGGTLVFIFITEGVGAGIVIDGNLYRGSKGTAGEIGHTTVDMNGPKCECGNNGCLEHYCSTISLIREVKNKLNNYPSSILNKDYSVKSIFSAFRSNDELANIVVNKLIKYLTYGIVNVINVFNPDIIIIGGEIIQAGPKFIEILKNSVREHILQEIYNSTVIELSSLNKNDEVALGASLIAISKILNNPALVIEYLKKNIKDKRKDVAGL